MLQCCTGSGFLTIFSSVIYIHTFIFRTANYCDDIFCSIGAVLGTGIRRQEYRRYIECCHHNSQGSVEAVPTLHAGRFQTLL